MSKIVTFYQNPKVDFLFGFFGGEPIPTKQDKFKPIELIEIDEKGNENILKNFYIKKPDRDAINDFHKSIKKVAMEQFSGGKIITKPNNVEVVLSVSVTESRYKEVDIDNLAKAVLDGLNGIAFEDDSQISSLICEKHIHPMKFNGLLIGLIKITPNNPGLGAGIKLFSKNKWDTHTAVRSL